MSVALAAPEPEPASDTIPSNGQEAPPPGPGRSPGRFAHVRQVDETDCGAACLAMICRSFGRSVRLGRIRKLVQTGRHGTSLRAICNGAEKLGLAARAVEVPAGAIDAMPLPAILHWEGTHWVVLYEVGERSARIADPATGRQRISRAELEKSWSGYAALFDYTEAFDRVPEADAGVGWLWSFVRPHLPLLLRAVGLSLVASALTMLFPVFTQVVVDRVLVEHDAALLNRLLPAMLAVLTFMMLSLYLQRYLLSFVAVRIDAATLDFVARKLLALPTSYFQARRTGDLQRRLEGMQAIRSFMVENAVSGLSAVTQLAGALALMTAYSGRLTLVFLATTPLYALLMRFSAKRLRPLFGRLEDGFGRYRSCQIDAIKGIEPLKASGSEGAMRERLLTEYHQIAGHVFRTDLTVMGYGAGVSTVGLLSVILFLVAGAHEVMDGRLTIGGLVAFNAIVGLANTPVGQLLNLWDEFQRSSVLVDRLNDVLEHEPEQGFDRSQLRPVPALEGHIRLTDVGFQYSDSETSILSGISLEIKPGEKLAIVGRSGSGKTTLARCLAGLLEPTQGVIEYDGRDLTTLDHRDLRRHVGFVLQDSHLFNETVLGNIAIGEEDPDEERVEWAARIAGAQAFIERLAAGYDTPLGETGIVLSGGQRQRIAIARALYHRPAVMIFDEATSFLDAESERTVSENLETQLASTTCIIIAHRLSTIRSADWVVVLDEGEIVEQGPPSLLRQRDGLFSHLYRQQLEG